MASISNKLIVLLLFYQQVLSISITCISESSPMSGTGTGATTSKTCTNADHTLVSCGFKVNGDGENDIRGSWISGQTCWAENMDGNGVWAIARCCDLSAYQVTCNTIKSTVSGPNDDEKISVSCQAGERLMGCTAQSNGDRMDGSYPGNVTDNALNLGNIDARVTNPTSCTAWNSEGNAAGVHAYATCCSSPDSKVTINCEAQWRDHTVNQFENGCDDVDQFMTSCSACNANRDMNQWEIIAGDECQVRNAPTQVSGDAGVNTALCCTITTAAPTTNPSVSPSKNPTTSPTKYPTKNPTVSPTKYPTDNPTKNPTTSPTKYPTKNPSTSPSKYPTSDPTFEPTFIPTHDPTKDPTNDPTFDPTFDPTTEPTTQPTLTPSKLPSFNPTKNPSNSPTKMPTNSPSKNPSKTPSNSPTKNPSNSPSKNPSKSPSKNPSNSPSNAPTFSSSPTLSPTDSTTNPSQTPTINPSQSPSNIPSQNPSMDPTKNPTSNPSQSPTSNPSEIPTISPTITPIITNYTISIEIRDCDNSEDINEQILTALRDHDNTIVLITETKCADDVVVVELSITTDPNQVLDNDVIAGVIEEQIEDDDRYGDIDVIDVSEQDDSKTKESDDLLNQFRSNEILFIAFIAMIGCLLICCLFCAYYYGKQKAQKKIIKQQSVQLTRVISMSSLNSNDSAVIQETDGGKEGNEDCDTDLTVPGAFKTDNNTTPITPESPNETTCMKSEVKSEEKNDIQNDIQTQMNEMMNMMPMPMPIPMPIPMPMTAAVLPPVPVSISPPNMSTGLLNEQENEEDAYEDEDEHYDEKDDEYEYYDEEDEDDDDGDELYTKQSHRTVGGDNVIPEGVLVTPGDPP